LRSTNRETRNTEKGRWRRLPLALRLLAVALVVVAVMLAILGWAWAPIQARAVVVLSSVLEPPVLEPALEDVTAEPRFEETVVAGNPTLIARPGGEGPWPALFFVNGMIPQGRKLPEVRHLAGGFARAGYLVVVPDLPGLTEDTLTPHTASETLDVARAVSGWPDARGGEVGLVGVSTGATLALLAAEKEGLEGRVSVVAGVAPYTDIKTTVSIATTGYYRRDGEEVRYKADPFLSYVIARSLISVLPPGQDRTTLLTEMNGVNRHDPDPLAGLRNRRLDDLGPEARSVVELLANENPDRFDKLYAGLPAQVRADLRKLSPLAGAKGLDAPVELVSGPHDKYFPVSESYAISRIAPDCRLTVSGALDHAQPSFSLQDLPGFLRLDFFVVRSLREASLRSD
jgi:pimeloyl-ACP methyl ester carboxylesterase